MPASGSLEASEQKSSLSANGLCSLCACAGTDGPLPEPYFNLCEWLFCSLVSARLSFVPSPLTYWLGLLTLAAMNDVLDLGCRLVPQSYSYFLLFRLLLCLVNFVKLLDVAIAVLFWCSVYH